MTEQDIEEAIRNTFGDTSGAPQADPNDFQPQGNYTPPNDTISPQLNSAQTYLSSQYGIFSNLVPNLSAFQGLGSLYSFTLNCSGLGLGTVTIDLSPYASQIQIVREATLVILSLVLVIKFIKHAGPTI